MIDKHSDPAALKRDIEAVRRIIAQAGGAITGPSTIRCVAYLRCVSGYPDGLRFTSHGGGPYSDDLSEALNSGYLLELDKKQIKTDWESYYFVYRTSLRARKDKFTAAAANADPVLLNILCCAICYHIEGCPAGRDPWTQTLIMKIGAEQNMLRAIGLNHFLCGFKTPKPLPNIALEAYLNDQRPS